MLAVALVAGCQPLPRPFAPQENAASNPLLAVKAGVGVAVLDLAGAPDPTSRAVTFALIDALLERNIPAALSAGSRRSIFVFGQAKAAPSAGGRRSVRALRAGLHHRGPIPLRRRGLHVDQPGQHRLRGLGNGVDVAGPGEGERRAARREPRRALSRLNHRDGAGGEKRAARESRIIE